MRWEKRSVKELCDITSSKRIFAADYQVEGIPFYRSKEIIERQKGGLKVSTELFISDEKYNEIKAKFGAPQSGDLLLTSVGTLGVPYVIKTGEIFYFKDGNLTWFRNFRCLASRYLYYWLLAPQGKAELQKCTIGSSQPAFTIVLLKGMSVELPPLPVQRKIAAILSAYDNLIENNIRRIQILEEMARNLYCEWFVNFRFPGHETVPMVESENGPLPDGWESVFVGDCLTLQRGFDLPVQNRDEGKFPIYASTGITGYHNQYKVRAPGVVTGRSGSLGTVTLALEDFWPLNTTLWIREFHRVKPVFAYYLLGSLDLAGYNSGAAVPTLNRNDAHKILVVLPSQHLLDDFEQAVMPIFELIFKLRQAIEVLRKTRDLLLPRLISGELDVVEIDIAGVQETEAAEV